MARTGYKRAIGNGETSVVSGGKAEGRELALRLYSAPSMPLPSPSLRIDFSAASGTLLGFGFGFGFDAGAPAPIGVACRRLAGPDLPEAWFAGDAAAQQQSPGLWVRRAGSLAAVAVEVEENGQGVQTAAEQAYRQLLAAVRPSAHPYMIRIWNYLAAINAGEGDAERYRRFCVGRARAVDAMFNDPPPAATAIGVDGAPSKVQVVALCASGPGIALENPRQTPAWQYPREYGPVPPGFSRGALIGEGAGQRLLASGTASIVGHVSQHPGDVRAQLQESLANLDALLAEGRARAGQRYARSGCEALRVYLRRAEDLDIARDVVAGSGLPAARVLYLRGDVCRRELLVEIEGVFAPQG